MKRISLAVALMAAAALTFASEELDVYAMMYRSSISVAERYAVLRNIAEAKLSDAGSLYAEALSKLLLEQPTLRGIAEKDAADAQARLLANLLGESKYAASAGDLWRVVQNFDNPLVKADALIAIGQTRSADLLPQVLKTLSELNIQPTADREAGEKIAYGAVIALEKYRSIEGYAPVFFTETGWYSKRVKDQAAKTLPLIVDDPSEALIAIMRSGDYSVKLSALGKSEGSKAAAPAKASVALAALEEGWKAATNDMKERIVLSQLRKKAIDMLIKNGSSAVSAVPLLERSFKEGIDTEERIAAVNALSRNKSDEAARALASFLMTFNGKRRAGDITQEDERIVRVVIPAIGANGNVLGRPALQAVEFQDWTNAVKVLAAESLKKIQ